jgi:hypothetical protein
MLGVYFAPGAGGGAGCIGDVTGGTGGWSSFVENNAFLNYNVGGNGGSSFLGTGGTGGNPTVSTTGGNGYGYGSGGGGGYAGTGGGNGANGVIIFSYTP